MKQIVEVVCSLEHVMCMINTTTMIAHTIFTEGIGHCNCWVCYLSLCLIGQYAIGISECQSLNKVLNVPEVSDLLLQLCTHKLP